MTIMKRGEERRFRRRAITLPCVVAWHGEKVSATISNLSPNGALVTQARSIPEEGSRVAVAFKLGGEAFSFNATVASKVIYSLWEITEEDQTASFGIEFKKVPPEVAARLRRLGDAEPKREPPRPSPE